MTSIHWTAGASCASMAIERFTVSRVGDPEVSHLKTTQAVGTYNRKKFKDAVEVCNSCPVRQECAEDASEADLYWTMRGGLTPTYYEGGAGVSRIPNVDTQEYLEYVCRSRRHVGDAYRGKKPSWRGNGSVVDYCIGCDNETSRRRGGGV